MTSWCEFFFLSLFFFFVSAKGWLLLRFASVELSRCQFWKAALEIWSLRLYISEQMPHPELPRPWHHWALARCLQDARLLWRQDFRGSPASRVGVFFLWRGGSALWQIGWVGESTGVGFFPQHSLGQLKTRPGPIANLRRALNLKRPAKNISVTPSRIGLRGRREMDDDKANLWAIQQWHHGLYTSRDGIAKITRCTWIIEKISNECEQWIERCTLLHPHHGLRSCRSIQFIVWGKNRSSL